MFLFNSPVFQIPRGTRDFTPEDMQKRNIIEEKIRNTFEIFGYKEIQTPVFEHLDLFTAKSGEGIINEIYSFNDKGGRQLALRPELTAPVIRFYVDKLQMRPKPLKLFYFGNCYRYDRPQKGRYREFKQAGCEIIGVETPESIAELIALAYNILSNIGLKEINLKIGNLKILSKIFDKIKLTDDQRKHLIPLIDKSMDEDIYQALIDFNIPAKQASDFLSVLNTNKIEEIKKYIGQDANEDIDKLNQVLEFLINSFKIKQSEIKIGIVRGLDYYDNIVFEIEAPNLGAEKQICGGGTYELLSLFGGRQTPTAGFAIGFDRSIIALETEGFEFPEQTIDFYVIPVNKDMIAKSIEISKILRENGQKTEIDLLRRGIGKSLKHADSLNAKKAVILGPKELEEESITVRDLKSGNQEKIKINDLNKVF